MAGPVRDRYDVIIIGAGPGGIFTALELLNTGADLKILMIDKGKDIHDRDCPMKFSNVSCTACVPCGLLSGWGGAGAFSDGKLSLSAEIGGFLNRYVDNETLQNLIRYVDQLYVRYGAPQRVYGENLDEIEKLKKAAAKNDLIFIHSKIRHIGTERCREVLKNIRTEINNRVDILFETKVRSMRVSGSTVSGVILSDGREIDARYVVVAPGREGSSWFEREAKRLKLTLLSNPVDIGLRIEVPATVLEPLTSITYEPKLVYYSKSFDDKVRTFCVNPYGEVVKEYLKGVWTVNGHSYAHKKTENTNFALLVSTYFTEPFNQPISYGRYIARLANFLAKGVLVQRLGDLRSGRRSTEERIRKAIVRPTLKDATPGDLSFALPYRFITDILEMLEALDGLCPGVNSRHTLLYGIEVKFYSMVLKLTEELETEIQNLFAVGDGAGVSRGLIQASASGIIAARAILNRLS